MSDNYERVARLAQGVSARQWRVLERRAVLLVTVSALTCLVFGVVAQGFNLADHFLSVFYFLISCLMAGAILGAVTLVGFARARRREIDAGYTTLDGELLGLPQLDHRTGEVLREANVQTPGG